MSSPPEIPENLLTARQAAFLLGVEERTVRGRARRAVENGDTQIVRIAGAWVATEQRWRDLFPGPVRIGRPKGSRDRTPRRLRAGRDGAPPHTGVPE